MAVFREKPGKGECPVADGILISASLSHLEPRLAHPDDPKRTVVL